MNKDIFQMNIKNQMKCSNEKNLLKIVHMNQKNVCIISGLGKVKRISWPSAAARTG